MTAETMSELARKAVEAELANPGQRMRVNLPTSQPKTLVERSNEIQQDIDSLRSEIQMRTDKILQKLDGFSRELQSVTQYIVDKIDR